MPTTDLSRRGRLTLAAGATALALLTGCGAAAKTGATPDTKPPAASSGPASTPGELTKGPLMKASPPTDVAIPKLKVTSRLVPLGTNTDGTMQVPVDAASVGWFTGAPSPGALGPAVLAGHVDWKGASGAFAHLTELTAGDEVVVTRTDGSRAAFSVTAVERHPKDEFPTQAVYGAIDHAGLRLITCGGEFDRGTGHYRDNIVVFATLQRAEPA